MSNMVDKGCLDTVYLTPPEILEPVKKYFGGQIGLDPATEKDNPTGAQEFFYENMLGEGIDGLVAPWSWYDLVFVNPPYGRALREWVEKIGEEVKYNLPLVALLPGQRFETEWWQRCLIVPELTAVVLIRRRVKFLRRDGTRAKSNPYGSMLYIFNGDVARAVKYFGHLGKVIGVTQLGELT